MVRRGRDRQDTMSNWDDAVVVRPRAQSTEQSWGHLWRRLLGLLALITPLAQPRVAGTVALIVYLVRAELSPTGLQPTIWPYFNYLADAFLHGQLSLRLLPPNDLDLVHYADEIYLYWPPFPAVLVMPLVALVGVGVSDVVYTAVFAAVGVALLAQFLAQLDHTGVAPLTVERRAILVASIAFGSVVLTLAPVGRVWFTAQIVGWNCVLLASLVALARRGVSGYFLTGLALACATATRLSLLFTAVWLAYYLWRRDRREPWHRRAAAAAAAGAPVVVTLGLLGAYNVARFGSPFEMGLDWHNVNSYFRADFERYGLFSLHYLPTNLYYQFIYHPLFDTSQWKMGGGIFWMTPVLLGALYAVWKQRRQPLIWALVVSCILVYIPIGLLMGTGYVTFGPRYLLDLMPPLLVLTAIGIRHWRLGILRVLLIISCATYVTGSVVWLITDA